MARRFRWRRVAKWIGATLTGLMLLAWAFSARFEGDMPITSPAFIRFAALMVPGTVPPSNNPPAAWPGGADFGFGEIWSGTLQPSNNPPVAWTGCAGFGLGEIWFGIWDGGFLGPVAPSIQQRSEFELGLEWPRRDVIIYSRMFRIIIPLWIPFLMCTAPTALLFYRDRRRIPPGHCPTCGYNLTGNTSGKCPECGERPPKPV